jgi:hypothetical protein
MSKRSILTLVSLAALSVPLVLMAGCAAEDEASLAAIPPAAEEGGSGGGPIGEGAGGSVATGGSDVSPAQTNLLFVLDRSGSMHLRVNPTDTRWSLTKAGLGNILQALPSDTAAGLAMFPAGDAPVTCCAITSGNYIDCGACGAGELPGTEQRCEPATYASLGVGVAALDATQVDAMMAYASTADQEFYWGTPLAPALQGELDDIAQRGLPGVSSVVLLTDGLPTSCNTASDPGANDIQRALDAVAAGASAGVRTYVVGIDAAASSTDPATDLATNLSALAAAAGTSRYAGCADAQDCAYVVNVDNFEQALSAALQEIALDAMSCAFELPDVQGGQPDFDQVNITVESGGQSSTIPRDASHANGWDYLPGNEQIQLYGDGCELLKSDASAKVQMVVGCTTQGV